MDCGHIKYQMSESTAKALLKLRKGDEKNMRVEDFLCHFVNTQYGLLYKCDSVQIKLDS